MPSSPLIQLRALEKQRSKIIDGAKAELLQRIERDLEQLNELGFHYSLSERSHRPKRRVNGKHISASDKPCSICGFATDKPHDARSHRWQKPKGPFSDKELGERNWRRL